MTRQLPNDQIARSVDYLEVSSQGLVSMKLGNTSTLASYVYVTTYVGAAGDGVPVWVEFHAAV